MSGLCWIVLTALVLLGCLLQPSAVLAAALIACLLLPLLSWAFLWYIKKHVDFQMETPSVVEKRTPVCLHICAKCRFGTRVSGVLRVENLATGECTRSKLRLRREQTVTLQSDFCGCLCCSLGKLRLWDICGVLPLPVSCNASKRILVMPDTFPVEICPDLAPTQAEDCQEYAQDRAGQDRTEQYCLRDYVPGDSLRQIHWKLFAKRGEPVVREAACPVDRLVMLFVDRTRSIATPVQSDAILEAAVSVAQALTEQGIRFHLCWNEEIIHDRQIDQQSQLLDAVADLLSAAGEIPGSTLYLRTCGAPDAGRVIYIGAQPPEDDFLRAAPCKVLLCEDSAACLDAMAQDLRMISWS